MAETSIGRRPVQPGYVRVPYRRPTIPEIAASVEPYVTACAIFLAPMRFFRLPGVFITFSDVVFGLALLLLFAAKRVPKAPLGPMTLTWFGGLFLLIAGLFASSIVNGNMVRGLILVGQYSFAYLVLSFILFERDGPRMKLFIQAFIAGMFTTELVGLYIYVTGHDPSGGRLLSGSERLMSFLEDPNANASMIALTLPLLFYAWSTRMISNLAVLVTVPVFLTAALLTSSVSGLTTVGFGLFLFSVSTLSMRVVSVVMAVAIIAAAGVATVGIDALPITFQKRVLGAFMSGDLEKAGTASDRLILMRQASEIIAENPVLGIGADQFRQKSYSSAPVHNSYLIVWVEGGIFSIIGWLMILSTLPMAALISYYLTRNRLRASVAFALGGMWLFIAFNNAHMYARFWTVAMMLALAICLPAIPQGEDSKDPLRRRNNKA